jgi:8-oxo-dGTP pyrophosphatase MutT (NUDIX family)
MKIKSNLIEAHIFYSMNDKIEFLLLKRSSDQVYPNLWQMVSGKNKKNETAVKTVLREVREETGVISKQLWIAPQINSFYDPKSDSINLIPVFAVRVDNKKVKLSNEHSDYKWVNSDEAQKMLAWPGQREAVKIIEDYFLNEKSFLNFVEVKIKS